jgi:hypothetical protein
MNQVSKYLQTHDKETTKAMLAKLANNETFLKFEFNNLHEQRLVSNNEELFCHQSGTIKNVSIYRCWAQDEFASSETWGTKSLEVTAGDVIIVNTNTAEIEIM